VEDIQIRESHMEKETQVPVTRIQNGPVMGSRNRTMTSPLAKFLNFSESGGSQGLKKDGKPELCRIGDAEP
jgi:hypothetical protein